MSDLFKEAKFGDKFITRDGRMAIYLGFLEGVGFTCAIKLENEYQLCDYYYNGMWNEYNHSGEHSLDIVGRWKEPIDGCKVIKLSKESNPYERLKRIDMYDAYSDGFYDGYCKAKEE